MPQAHPLGRKHLAVPFALLASLTFVGTACGSSSPGTPGMTGTTAAPATGAITVSAATSLATPLKRIGDDFKKANPGVEITFTFDSSSTLVTQIQNGSPVDVFASADDANMTRLTDAHLIAGSPQRFARNRLAIVVKKGNPKGIKTLADLATAGTVSLCAADAPCGRYAGQILTSANVTIPAEHITRGQNVKATFTAVSEGDADAGIVYVTDVTGDKAEAVTIPEAEYALANYPIGVVEASANPTTARAFVAYVTSAAGQATLKTTGFLPPS